MRVIVLAILIVLNVIAYGEVRRVLAPPPELPPIVTLTRAA